MSDYARANSGGATHFGDKDALTSGDTDKKIVGAQFDSEFNAILTAVNSKYDSDNIASEAEAQASSGGSGSNSVLMTPLRVGSWALDNAGILADLQAIASNDGNGDALFFLDDTDDTAKLLTVGTGLAITGTSIATDDSAIAHDSLSGFVSDEHVAHSGVSVLGSNSGLAVSNNDLSTNIGLVIDVSVLTEYTGTSAADLDADQVILDVSGTGDRRTNAAVLLTPEVPTSVSGTTDTLAETDFGKVIRYSGTECTVTLPNGLKDGFWATLLFTGTAGNGLILSATTTLNTVNSLTTCTQTYGAVTVFHAGSNVWYAWGALDS